MTAKLVTGLPGSGKTALVVDWLAHTDEFRGRPLFVMGVPDLKIEHQPVPPVEDWTELRPSPEDPGLLLPYFTFPPHAVVWLDECQRVYRPRSTGSKVPPEVAAFETHRHTGIDFILTTQHPNLIDANVRKLIGSHVHVHVHMLGRDLLEWPKVHDVDSRTDRALANRTKGYKPPKRVFSLYKSAEAHTKLKRTIPKSVYVVAIALVLFLILVVVGYRALKARTEPAAAAAPGQTSSGRISGGVSGKGPAPVKSAAEYVAAHIPRIPDLPHTAPIYDAVTQPQEAPYPVGCVESKTACKCIDQQGNRYATSRDICRAFVHDGMFLAFKARPESTAAARPSSASKGS